MRSANPSSRLFGVAAVWALSFAAIGCSRDLEMPPLPSGPALSSFSPAAAYAGQLLRVTGSHLDPDATANTVNFAHASARGERWDGGDLVVRVPADAGDGPITLGNRDGTSSASSAPFDYLGLGEPRRGQIVSSSPILHHPQRVHSVGGSVFLESRLYGSRDGAFAGLVGYAGATSGPDPFASAATTAPWRNLLVYTVDDGTGTWVTLVDQFAQTSSRVHLDGVNPWRLVAVKGAQFVSGAFDVLVTFQTNATLGETMAIWKLDDLIAPTPSNVPFVAEGPIVTGYPTPHTITSLTGAVATDDGRIVAVGKSDATGDAIGLVGITFSGAAHPFFVLPPPGRTIEANVSDRYFEGLAVGTRSTGYAPTAAFALDGGRLGLLALEPALDQASADAATRVVGTWSAAPIRGIALRPTEEMTPQLTAIATKPDDDLVLGVKVALFPGTDSDYVAWGLPTQGAARAAVDPTAPSIALVANDRDNEVQVINVTTGRQVGRLGFDAAPTSISAATGLAFSPADPLDFTTTDELYLVAGNPAAVLVHPLGFGQPACAWRPTSAPALARDPAGRAVWGAAAGSPMEIATLGGPSPVFATGAPAGQPLAAAFAGGALIVGSDAGLTAISGGAVTGTWAPPSPPAWYSLGSAPTGELFAVGSWDFVDRVQLWQPDQLVAGGAPVAEWATSPTDPWILWGVWLEDGLWVDTLDAGTLVPSMVRLDQDGATLVPAVSVTPAAAANFMLIPPAAISPNGRKLVMWEFRGLVDTALRIFSADPATGFAEQAYISLDGTITGAAFDATGERLYVLTQAPDRIVTID